MDNSFFIIRVCEQKIIEVYFYSYKNSLQNNKHYPICFVCQLYDFSQMVNLLSLCNNIINCSSIHKFYLGKEIFKAQISIQLQQYYVQD
uniref:DUF4346 domain-containing protein n=1 Tax=Polysiphonia elongata TaxID=159753 RepID=A0A1Z1MBV2_9FLOR|nr:hypothetical protein [Polysiphonia elongata]ARW63285.1 hypothetical protein [Polysiphonia elongata]